MDNDTRLFLLGAMPALCAPPPATSEFFRHLITVLIMITRPPPEPLLDLRYRLGDNREYSWLGRDVYGLFAKNTLGFFEITSETPETLNELVKELSPCFRKRNYKLSPRNRVLLFVLWLRSYPSYYMLSMLFDISVSTVCDEIDLLLPCFSSVIPSYVKWPSIDEWQALSGQWLKLLGAVGAIDGTSTEIYRPQIESQALYYSGHRHYHAIHTQVIVDNDGIIRYVESGFLGHQNDAQQFRLMDEIGGPDLPFPPDCCLLGDKIYPNRHPVMTPYTQQQIDRKTPAIQRKCLKFNKILSEYRVLVEHSIKELKCYQIVSSIWRHPRNKLKRVIKIIAGLICRRKSLI